MQILVGFIQAPVEVGSQQGLVAPLDPAEFLGDMTFVEHGRESPPSPEAIPEPGPFPTIRSGFCADKGGRRSMEDAHVVMDDISPMTSACGLRHYPQAFYGVFDGHGGPSAAAYLKDVLLGRLTADRDFPSRVGRAMVNAFLQTDRELEKQWRAGGRHDDAGTTALAALVLGRMLYVANAGDCRAVMSQRGKAVEITRDHRAVCMIERSRVEAAGGMVIEEYLNDKLAVTRALGDWHMEDLKRRTDADGATSTTGPLIAEPEVFESVLCEGDEFLVMACDGLWDAFQGRSQEVISRARRHLSQHNDPLQCSKDLVDEAIRRDASDNITVVVVCFFENLNVDMIRSPGSHGSGVNASPRTMRRSISVEAMSRLQGILRDA